MKQMIRRNQWRWLGLLGVVLLGMFLYDRWPVQYSEHDAELDQIYDRLFQQESYADVNNEFQLQDRVPGVYYIPKPDSPQTYESWLELDRIKEKRVVKDQEAKWVLEAVYAYDDFDAEMLEACQTVVRELEKISVTGVLSGRVIIYLNEFTHARTSPNEGNVYTKKGVISKKYSDQDIYQKFKRNRPLKNAFRILENKGIYAIDYGLNDADYDEKNQIHRAPWPIIFCHKVHTRVHYYYSRYIRYTPKNNSDDSYDVDAAYVVEENQWGVYHQPDWGYGISRFYPFQQIKEELMPAYLETYEPAGVEGE